MFAEIKGQIERITYYNEENGYTIEKVKVVASALLDTKTKNRIFLPTHIQPRSATQEEATSSGVLNPRHFLGRLLINDSI